MKNILQRINRVLGPCSAHTNVQGPCRSLPGCCFQGSGQHRLGCDGDTCVCRASETGQSINLKLAVIYSKAACSGMQMCAFSIYPVILTQVTARSLFKYYLCDVHNIVMKISIQGG